MRKNWKKIGSGIVMVMAIMTAGTVFSEPGSNRDPLVSVSYVDKKIEEVKDYIDLKIKNTTASKPVGNSAKGELEIIVLQKGQSLIGESGTEIILRSGKAVAIGSELGGISDVTSGKDIDTNMDISENHLLIVPRDDGRGVYSRTETFFMVRGNYKIQ